MVVFLIVDKVIYEEDVSEVDEAIALIRLLRIIIFIRRQLQIIKVVFMVFLKIILYFIVRIPARYIFHHQSRPSFFTCEYLLQINGPTVVSAHI